MKTKFKALCLTMLMTATIALTATTVNAATPKEDLLQYLSKDFTVAGQAVSLTDSQKLKVERYLDTNDVTAEQVSSAKAKVEETVAYVNETGVKDLSKLTTAQKQEVLAKANDTASVLGLSLTYDSTDQAVKVYQGSTLVDTVTDSNKLVQTGGINVAAVAGTILAIIAIAGIIIKKVK